MSKVAYRTKVIVIGAGVSGLACARELSHRGYQVLVVEARSRVGGRLKGGLGHFAENSKDGGGLITLGDFEKGKSKKLSTTSTFVDLGGALIHGIEGNPVYSITEEMGIPTKPISDCLLFDTSGWPVDFREDEKVSVIFNECLEETFSRISKGETPRELRRAKNSSLSFGTIFDIVCEEKGAPHNHPLFKWYQANLEVSCGASFPDLGYQWNEDEPYGFNGDHVAVETSWNTVVEGLAEGLEILYRCPVQRVSLVVPKHTAPSDQEKSQVPSDGVNSSNNEAGSSRKRKRQLDSGRNLHAMPVHPSRRSRRLLGQDAHTRRSSRANKGVMANKFEILDFAAESYDVDSGQTSRKSPSRSRRNEKTVVQVTLENGKVLEGDAVVCTLPLGILKIAEGSAGHIQFDPPLSLPKQEAIQRLGCGLLNKCVLSFPHVFWQDSDFLGLAHKYNSYLVLNAATYINKPVLIFMYGGAFAKEVESWTDMEIVQDCIAVLKLVCTKEVPTLLDYQVTRWGHERFSRMSFSYVPPGVDGALELQALSEPIYDPHVPTRPVIMFAGEHTTQFHPSTIHGAFMSGIREAYRLDLIIDPEGNHNLEFKEDELYEHTFRVRRQLGETTEDSVTSAPKEEVQQKESRSLALKKQKQQHRRRGAAFVMTLRNRPKENENLSKSVPAKQTVTESPTKGALVPHGSPARRSQRSLSTLQRQQMDETKAESDEEKASKIRRDKVSKEHLTALETRTLLRAIESYGENYEYIQSHVLPVFAEGAGECTVGETRARCKQLLRSTAGTNSKPFRMWKYWESKKVVTPADVESVQNPRPLPAQKVPSNGKRNPTSGRKQNSRSKSVSPVTTPVERNYRETKRQVVGSSVFKHESKQNVNESKNPMHTKAATRASPRVSKPRNRLDL